jgi:hypothetical protein
MVYLTTSTEFGLAYYTESALDALHLIGEGHAYTTIWGDLDKDLPVVYTTFRGELNSASIQKTEEELDYDRLEKMFLEGI